jgi:hypothetical protein
LISSISMVDEILLIIRTNTCYCHNSSTTNSSTIISQACLWFLTDVLVTRSTRATISFPKHVCDFWQISRACLWFLTDDISYYQPDVHVTRSTRALHGRNHVSVWISGLDSAAATRVCVTWSTKQPRGGQAHAHDAISGRVSKRHTKHKCCCDRALC